MITVNKIESDIQDMLNFLAEKITPGGSNSEILTSVMIVHDRMMVEQTEECIERVKEEPENAAFIKQEGMLKDYIVLAGTIAILKDLKRKEGDKEITFGKLESAAMLSSKMHMSNRLEELLEETDGD